MSFLSRTVTHRRFVLVCASLLVQFVMGWSIPRTGMDELECFRVPDGTNGKSIARNERQLIAQGFDTVLAKLRQTRERRSPC
jgi:hypothetical protein